MTENNAYSWPSISMHSQLLIEITVFDSRLVESMDVKPTDTEADCIYWRKSASKWTCTVQTHVVQGSTTHMKKCAFAFLEFLVFLTGCWRNCVSTLYRALDVVDEGHGECQEFTLHCGESQFFHTTDEVPSPFPGESGMCKKVMLHFQYLAFRNKHFHELKHCKITPVWLTNTYLKRM